MSPAPADCAPRVRVTDWALSALALALGFFPWVEPFAPGPSPSVVPWLASAACAVGLGLVAAARGSLPRAALVAWLAAFALWTFVVTGVRPEVVMLAGGLAVVAIASSVPARDADGSLARAVQWAWLAAAAASAVIGLAQYFGLGQALRPWVSVAQLGEAFGNLRQPNQFASLCSIGMAVVLWGGMRLPTSVAAGLMALLAAGSAASVSRTGAVQGLMLAVLALAWSGPQRRRRLLLCALGAAAYLLASWAWPVLLEAATGVVPERTLGGRLGGGNAPACSSRTVLWSNVLQLVARRPVMGWGWGELDYAHFTHLYPGARFCDILDNAHNLPLHLAVELGAPAAVLACVAMLAWAVRLRPWAETVPLRQLAWALLAIVLLHNLLEYPLWYGPFQVVAGVAVGWLMRPPTSGAEPESEPRTRRIALAVYGVLLAATAYAAWDYTRVAQIYVAPAERLAPWRDDTLDHVRRSWLFQGQAGFADLTLATVTRENAQWMYDLATRELHYSPEPRVIERLIESETMLGRVDEAVVDLARYRAAFPVEYAAWRKAQKLPRTVP